MSDNKPHRHFESSSWLLEKHFDERINHNFKGRSIHGGVSTVGIGDIGKARVLRFDQKDIRNHIQKWLKDKVRNRFQGIKDFLPNLLC